MILFIKNIDIEGPETLGAFFLKKNIKTQTIELDRGEKLPQDLTGVDAVVVFGGPMNVYEEDKYPFLKEENSFIQRVLKEEIPYLGLCLGSQLLAKASGAAVIKSPQQEIGFSLIDLTSDGLQDALFCDIDQTCKVFQWHSDMSQMPQGAKLLAASNACRHQAFKIGTNAYGLQFHIEITDRSIAEWSDKYFEMDSKEHLVKKNVMLDQYVQIKDEFNLTAQKIYENFFKIINNKVITT